MHPTAAPPSAAAATRPRTVEAAGPPALDPLFAEFLRQAGAAPASLREWVDLAEAWRIARALRDCRGNRSAAARQLGIGRRTLYTKMEKLGLAERWDAPVLESTRP